MLIQRLLLLCVALIIGTIIGTYIKLRRLNCRFCGAFSVLVPITVVVYTIQWCLSEDEVNMESRSLIQVIRKLKFAIYNLTNLLTIGCYSLVEAQQEVDLKNKNTSTDVIGVSKKTYEKEVDDLYLKFASLA